MNEIVYVITSGDYSNEDYTVEGIASTHERAQELCKLFAADNVFPLEVDPEVFRHDGKYFWRVEIDSDFNPNNGDYMQVDLFDCRQASTVKQWEPFYDDSRVIFHVWATDSDDAKQSVIAMRQQLIDSGEYTTNWSDYQLRNPPF